MSIVAAGTTTTTALVQTGNTDGTLQLQVNGTTPSVTLNTLGAIGVGSSPNYGTSGQVLTSGGATVAPTWASISTTPTIVRSARTSNTILGTGDASKLIAITSGTFTQTFTAAATLGSGWFCYIQNSGTGDITLDPNGSETIDGLTSYIMYPGEARLVQCDGTAFYTVVLEGFYREFTSSGTFTKPPGYNLFEGLVWGGGGSGAKNGSGAIAGGGGGGACVPFMLRASQLGATETITIAATATGPSTSTTDGTNGNNSTFGLLVTAYGGGGGKYNAGNGYGGPGGGALSAGASSATGSTTGGSPSVGTSDNTGFGGGNSSTASGVAGSAAAYGGGGGGTGYNTTNPAFPGGAGGAALYGGGGGGGSHGVDAGCGAGGASKFGGSGGAALSSTSGVNGTAPGGGGGGTYAGTKAGDGARGELRIWGTV